MANLKISQLPSGTFSAGVMFPAADLSQPVGSQDIQINGSQISQAAVNALSGTISSINGTLTLLQTNISAETTRAEGVESTLSTGISTINSTALFQDTDINTTGYTSTSVSGSVPRTIGNHLNDTVNVKQFGAIGDGNSHPLSSIGTLGLTNTTGWTLTQWQAVFPFATSLTQELDFCAFQTAVNYGTTLNTLNSSITSTGFKGNSGIEILVPSGYYMMGASTLNANNVAISFRGHGQRQSWVQVNGVSWLNFGLSNGVGIAGLSFSTGGTGFAIGDLVVPTGGTYTTQSVIKVTNVDDLGGVTTFSIVTAGSYSVIPPPTSNRVAMIPQGSSTGSGLSMTLTYTSGALTSTKLAADGTGYSVNDVLSAVGGYAVGGNIQTGTPTQAFQLTVRAIDSNGAVVTYSITNPGSYGLPPPNPVMFTGGTGTGFAVNTSSYTQVGGSLKIENMAFVSGGQGGTCINAQFATGNSNVQMRNLLFCYTGTTNYFTTLFSFLGGENAVFENIDAFNLYTLNNVRVADAAFIFNKANNYGGVDGLSFRDVNTLGFYEHYRIIANGAAQQGLYWLFCSAAQGINMINLINNGTTEFVEIVCLNAQSQVDGYTITGTNVGGLQCTNCVTILGHGRSLASDVPATTGMLQLYGASNNAQIIGNSIGTSGLAAATQQLICIDHYGIYGIFTGNRFTNAANTGGGNALAYRFNSGTGTNQQYNDTIPPVGFASPAIIDNGTNVTPNTQNVTQLQPTIFAQANGNVSFGNLNNGVQAMVVDPGSIYTRFIPQLTGGNQTTGANYQVQSTVPAIVLTTTADCPTGSTTMTVANTTGIIGGLVMSGQAGLASATLVTTATSTTVTFSQPTTADIPSGSTVSFIEYAGDLYLSPYGDGQIYVNGAYGSSYTTVTPTNGGTLTLQDGVSCFYFGNSAIASTTIIMPANPRPGQEISFLFFGTITALTVSANANQTIGGAPTTASVTTPFTMKYLGGRWQLKG